MQLLWRWQRAVHFALTVEYPVLSVGDAPFLVDRHQKVAPVAILYHLGAHRVKVYARMLGPPGRGAVVIGTIDQSRLRRQVTRAHDSLADAVPGGLVGARGGSRTGDRCRLTTLDSDSCAAGSC